MADFTNLGLRVTPDVVTHVQTKLPRATLSGLTQIQGLSNPPSGLPSLKKYVLFPSKEMNRDGFSNARSWDWHQSVLALVGNGGSWKAPSIFSIFLLTSFLRICNVLSRMLGCPTFSENALPKYLSCPPKLVIGVGNPTRSLLEFHILTYLSYYCLRNNSSCVHT